MPEKRNVKKDREIVRSNLVEIIKTLQNVTDVISAEISRLISNEDSLNPIEYSRLEHLIQMSRGMEIEYTRSLTKIMGILDREGEEISTIISESTALLGENFDRYWVICNQKIGLVLTCSLDEVPHIQQLRQEWSNGEISLGQIMYQLSKDRTKKNDFDYLDENQFAFILKIFQKVIDTYGEIGIKNIINFFEFASAQHHNYQDQPIVSESLPPELSDVNSYLSALRKKNVDIWQTTLQLRSFAHAFMSSCIHTLTHEDSQNHQAIVEIITALFPIKTLKNGSKPLKTPDIVAYLYSFAARTDSLKGTNTVVSLLKSLEHERENTWAHEIYTHFYQSISGEFGLYGVSKRLLRLLNIDAHNYSKAQLLEGIGQISKIFQKHKQNEFLVSRRITLETGSTNSTIGEVLNLNHYDDFFITVRYEPEEELIHVRTMLVKDGQIIVFTYIVDIFVPEGETEPLLKVHPNIIDPEVIQDNPMMVESLLYILQVTIDEYLLYEQIQAENREAMRPKKPVSKAALHNITDNRSSSTIDTTHSILRDTHNTQPQQIHRYIPKKRHNGNTQVDESERIEDTYLVNEIKSRRNVQPINTQGIEDLFPENIDESNRVLILQKIQEYNSAINKDYGIIAGTKALGGLIGPNNGTLFQIRAGRYRVLCEMGEGKNSNATILEIYLKTDEIAARIFKKYRR